MYLKVSRPQLYWDTTLALRSAESALNTGTRHAMILNMFWHSNVLRARSTVLARATKLVKNQDPTTWRPPSP